MRKNNPLFTILKKYYNKYSKEDNTLSENDIYNNGKIMLMRGEYKSYLNCDKKMLQNNPKKINGFITNEFNKNPLEQFNTLSILQQHIMKNSDNFLYEGFSCFTASCGDGKTMAAIYLMYVLGLKTLIISSRNAVNDQWKKELQNLYPNLNIKTRIDVVKPEIKKRTINKKDLDNEQINSDVDVMICTPQYLIPKIENPKDNKQFFNEMQFDLIIYDEIHSLLSEQFSLVLALPFLLKLNGFIKHLPYMLGLTASLPHPTSIEYKFIKIIFGEPIVFNSKITNIPVFYLDHRDLVKNRSFCDLNYVAFNDKEAFEYYSDLMLEKNLLPSIDYKTIIITGSIDSSIYAGINACIKFNIPVLIMRANNEKSIYITPETIPEFYRDIEEQSEKPDFTYEEIKHTKTLKYIQDYSTVLNQVGIIVGTYHRLKEGFNCKNIVYGICTSFIWSETSRVQILGRIRRNSDNPDLNKHKRIFFVNSGRIPSNFFTKLAHQRLETTYNEEYEKELFKKENYIKITEDMV